MARWGGQLVDEIAGPRWGGAAIEAPRPVASADAWSGPLAELGASVWDAAVYHTPAAVAAAMEGDDPFAEIDWKDRLIERARQRVKDRNFNSPSIENLGPSLGFSAAGWLAGLATGVPAGALGGPLVGYGVGGTASGVAAYRMATNQFVRDLYESANEEEKANTGHELSIDAFRARQEQLANVIRSYGLWEAVPEAAGNMISFGVLKAPVKTAIGSLFGKNVLTRIATKLGALYGEELATETVTQMGQQRAEAVTGVTPEAPREWTSAGDWAESFNEIAGPVILQTTLMAGAGSVGIRAYEAATGVSQQQAEVTGEKRARNAPISTLTADQVLNFARERQAELELQAELSPQEELELNALRTSQDRPEAIAAAYGIPMQALGEREAARAAAPELSAADQASPIPSDLVQEGRDLIADSEGVQRAGRLLEQAGMPAIGEQVTLDGVRGTIVDAYERGTERGLKFQTEDGNVQQHPLDSLTGRLAPVEVQGAQEVRGNQGQVQERRNELQGGQNAGRENLQRTAQARPSARYAGTPLVSEEAAGTAQREGRPAEWSQLLTTPAPVEEVFQNENLKGEDKQIEQRMRETVADFPAAVEKYNALPEAEGGRNLSADVARELSDDYVRDKTHSGAVHEGASWFINRYYLGKLSQPTPVGRDATVAFTAGGTGAGKTSGLRKLIELGLRPNWEMSYDTNMANFSSAVRKIDQALNAGRNVEIYYVYREPVEAFENGVLPRAMRMGRTVPIDVHARTHVRGYETIRQIAEHYAGDERVKIDVIDNSRGKDAAQLSSLEKIPAVEYTGLEEKLREALERKRAANQVSEHVYRGVLKLEGPQAPEENQRGALRGEPQPQRAEQRPNVVTALPRPSKPAPRAAAPAAARVVSDIQEFGDLQLSETVEIDGELVDTQASAQRLFEQARDRKKILERLNGCLRARAS